MNPAVALAVLLSGTEKTIHRQKVKGQQTIVNGTQLPKKMGNLSREELTTIGFEFGRDTDDLFVECKLPEGWKKVRTDHSMYSDLLDEQGRRRASIFYKAVFYDSKAEMSMLRRYNIDCYAKSEIPEMRKIHVIDWNGDVIHDLGDVGNEDWAGQDALGDAAVAWLDEQYPEWKNPLAHW